MWRYEKIMKHLFHKNEDIDRYMEDKEFIANTYVMRCFFVSMIVYSIGFLLNILNIFIVDKSIMLTGFIPSVFVYLIMLIVTKKVSLSSPKIKYFILLSIVSVFTLIGVTITYHVALIAVLPILYAILYSSRKVMWYVYGLTVVSTIIIVYAGYYFGLCDANMALLTNTRLDNYIMDGYFQLTAVNSNPLVTLMLYFVVPRCLIYVAFMVVISNIFRVVRAGLEKAECVTKMEVFQRELKRKVDEQTVEIREQQAKTQKAYWQTITALSEAVDAKDRYTSGHSKRVAEYSKLIAKKMGKSESEQEQIYRAGLLHDVGKIRIPVYIINKPGRLTDEEYELIKLHSITGYHILRNISEHGDMAVAAKYHHERYDGRGYPNGLVGENIPEMARILAVADSYDAMTSNRSYRKALSQDIVRGEIEKGRGTQFDPNVAEVMLQLIDEDSEYTMKQIDKTLFRILMAGESTGCNQKVKETLQQESMYEIDVLNTVTLEAMSNMLDEQNFDLIIFDIQAGRSESWKILGEIKEKYQVPIIIMSDDKNLRTTKEFNEFGCHDYFTKPFTSLMLNEIIYNMTKECV